MKEIIVCSAIIHNRVIFQGRRHHDAIKLAVDSIGDPPAGDVQGFWSNWNRFLSRKEALEMAIESGQVDPEKLCNAAIGLFSEDLY